MRTPHILLAASLLAGVSGIALAQNAATYDPDQLPTTRGKVAEYSLTPRGDVDGLILADGTEVHLPPHLGTQLVYAVRPGDAVTIHGLRARTIPMVQAMSVSNDATGRSVTDTGSAGPGNPPGPRGMQPSLTAQGRVKAQLHGPQGELNGAMLEDGTIVRLPPPEARRLVAELAPGATLYVEGNGFTGALGHVIEARSIGPSADRLAQVAAPPHRGLGWLSGGADMGPPPPPPPPPGGPDAPPPAP